MACLGVRCSNNGYSYVIITGDKGSPKVKEKGGATIPKGFTRGQSLKWLLQEFDPIFSRHSITAVAIKGPEGLAMRGKAFVERTENEAIVYLAAANHGVKFVSKKTKATIAKDLGLKGNAKSLETDLDYSSIGGFEAESATIKEAILVAWSTRRG